ncbi:DUF4112 domain-containing protein [Niveispirillum sp. KHB5.9]|uniref:DUF4112 domain-containing protein n=1 Tax=Niveispirillum sp. KHB5.9 TaxID=3400269 RepID=UPI003A8B7520
MSHPLDHYSPRFETHTDSHWRVRRRLDRVARLLDSAVRLPVVGWRVGLDAPLNLIPGAGLALSTGVAAWLVWEGSRLGAPKRLVTRMAGNVVIDSLISAIPVVGWLGDLFFRANDRNVELLRRHLDGKHPFRQRRHGRGGIIDG